MNELKDPTFRLAMAGNTLIPCALVLESLGYMIFKESSSNHETWLAKKDETTFLGDDPCQLLGLIKLVEFRGKTWQASDEEINVFLKRFYDNS